MTKDPGPAIAVVGTDTGVGKTLLAAALARCLSRRAGAVGVFKPAETGCPTHASGLAPTDALFLKTAARCASPLEVINPFRFALAASPAAAAAAAGASVSYSHLANQLSILRHHHRITLVEGAGGLMVPFTDTLLFADLLAAWELPVLVVGRSSLGTINHTLLTLSELARRRIQVLGVILNRLSHRPGPEEKSTPETICRHGRFPLLGMLPHVPERHRTDPEYLADVAEQHLNLAPVLEQILLSDAEA